MRAGRQTGARAREETRVLIHSVCVTRASCAKWAPLQPSRGGSGGASGGAPPAAARGESAHSAQANERCLRVCDMSRRHAVPVSRATRRSRAASSSAFTACAGQHASAPLRWAHLACQERRLLARASLRRALAACCSASRRLLMLIWMTNPAIHTETPGARASGACVRDCARVAPWYPKRFCSAREKTQSRSSARLQRRPWRPAGRAQRPSRRQRRVRCAASAGAAAAALRGVRAAATPAARRTARGTPWRRRDGAQRRLRALRHRRCVGVVRSSRKRCALRCAAAPRTARDTPAAPSNVVCSVYSTAAALLGLCDTRPYRTLFSCCVHPHTLR